MATKFRPEIVVDRNSRPADAAPVPTRALRIALASEAPLILVAAPAGYGKTSLLKAMEAAAASSGAVIAWRSVDACSLEDAPSGHADLVLIDDAHLVEPRRLQRLIRAIAAGGTASPTRHVVATRTLPEADWLSLQLGGVACLLRVEDMVLDTEETESLLRLYSGTTAIPADLGATVQGRTEGWPIAVQMCGLLAKRRGRLSQEAVAEVARSGDLFRYLDDALYDDLDDAMRDFLLKIGQFERFSLPMVSALMGPSAAPLLARAVKENLMILPAAGSGDEFRLHDVFRSFLRQRRLEDGMPIDGDLIRRAAAWSIDAGFVADGIELLLRAGAAEEAQREAVRHAPALFNDAGEIVRLLQWSGEIERALGTMTPALRLWRCWGLVLTLELAAAEEQLRLASGDLNDDTPRDVLAHRDRLRISLASQHGRFAEVVVMAEAWLNDWGESFPFHATAVTALHAVATRALGRPDTSRGDLATARRLARGSGQRCAHMWVVVIDALLELDAGRASRARTMIEKEIADVEGCGTVARSMVSLMRSVAARLALETGDWPEAARQLRTARTHTKEHGIVETLFARIETAALIARSDSGVDAALAEMRLSAIPGRRLATLTAIRTVQLLLADGQVDEAAKVFDCELADAETSMLERDVLGAALHLRSGRLDEARADCERLIPLCTAGDRGRLLLSVLMIAIGVAEGLGEGATARRHWQRALRLAASGGLVQTAIDHAWAVASHVRTIDDIDRLTGPEAAMMARITSAAGIDATRVARVPVETLTPRECEVLRLLDSGLTSERLARRMELSQSTAKWHIKNIYAKLGAHNRSGALARARQNALI